MKCSLIKNELLDEMSGSELLASAYNFAMWHFHLWRNDADLFPLATIIARGKDQHYERCRINYD